MTATFRPPSDAQVNEVARRIPTFQLRRAFFEGLKNPLWVAPLAKKGFFDKPPEPQRTDDGLIRDTYWPEIGYLARVAPDVPEPVVNVLLSYGNSTNSWVRRGVFSIGATIPADQAVRLKPLIKSWGSSGFGWRTDPRDLVAFALNLIAGGQTEAGIWFATLLFKPFKAQDSSRPTARLEPYWYEEGLPKFASALGDAGLVVVLPWLVDYERSSGNLKRDVDLTYYSRESIRSRGDGHEDIEQALIDVVRDSAVRAMLSNGSGAKRALLDAKMLLGRKIALYAVSEAIRQTADTEGMKGLLPIATELLFDVKSSDDSCRIDYGELARSVAAVSANLLENLAQFIESGSHVYKNARRERMLETGIDEADVDELVQECEDRWKHRWLSAIGIEALPPLLAGTLAGLDSKYGVVDQPLVPVPRITTWVGPNSPISQEGMAAMSPFELVAHLASWRDTGDGWGPSPSHEGQARELTALMTTNPKIVAGISDLVGRLRPTYLRAILRGWEASITAGLEPDWAQVAEVVTDVLDHDDVSSFPPEGGRGDDDPDFRWAKQAAVGLLEQLAQKRDALTVPQEAMARFAELLVASAADETAWAEYISTAADSSMDPLTISLNWQWPIRVRGLVYLMSHGREASWYESARSALESELSRQDVPGASRAVMGRSLSRLLLADPAWLESMVSELFGSETELSVSQQIALTTAIASHHYHSTLYNLLAPSMVAAVRHGESIVAGWRTQIEPLQQIGAWVINAIIRGHISDDDRVANAFFSAAPPQVRGDSLGHVAWTFMHAQKVDGLIRNRLGKLWDLRVEHVRVHAEDRGELNGFYWFIKSNKFGVRWWLPRLREALELDPELASERCMIGKEIALSADVDPRNALEVTRLLLRGRDESGITAHDLTRNAVPMVIARCITSGDQNLKQEAEVYMNELGEAGNLGFQAEVTKFLDGEAGIDDVDE